MSDPLDQTPAPDTSPLDLGDSRTVLFDEPTSGFYRVRVANGEVQAFPARAEATRENALADLVTNPPPPQPPTVDECTAAVQARLDALARSWGYDHMLSLCTYHESAVARFSAEAAAGLAWRDATWSAAGAVLAAVQAGGPAPATVAGFLATLPAEPLRPA